jgi:hypothetical protein
MLTQLLSTTIALSPLADPAPQDFESRLDHVEFEGDESDAQLIAYDAEDEVIGIISIEIGPGERVYLASDYGDGYAETTVVDGEARTEATLPGEVISLRAKLVLSRAGRHGAENWFSCAALVGGAVALCAPPLVAGAIVVTCPTGIGLAACECFPLAGLDSPCEI